MQTRVYVNTKMVKLKCYRNTKEKKTQLTNCFNEHDLICLWGPILVNRHICNKNIYKMFIGN